MGSRKRPFDGCKIIPAGNTAVHGVKIALGVDEEHGEFSNIMEITGHIPLGESPMFQQ